MLIVPWEQKPMVSNDDLMSIHYALSQDIMFLTVQMNETI